jgi:hypothetical protein
VGLRFSLFRDGAQSRLTVTDVTDLSSASRSEQPIHLGDVLTHIDNHAFSPSAFDQKSEASTFLGLLLGAPGSEVNYLSPNYIGETRHCCSVESHPTCTTRAKKIILRTARSHSSTFLSKHLTQSSRTFNESNHLGAGSGDISAAEWWDSVDDARTGRRGALESLGRSGRSSPRLRSTRAVAVSTGAAGGGGGGAMQPASSQGGQRRGAGAVISVKAILACFCVGPA